MEYKKEVLFSKEQNTYYQNLLFDVTDVNNNLRNEDLRFVSDRPTTKSPLRLKGFE